MMNSADTAGVHRISKILIPVFAVAQNCANTNLPECMTRNRAGIGRQGQSQEEISGAGVHLL